MNLVIELIFSFLFHAILTSKIYRFISVFYRNIFDRILHRTWAEHKTATNLGMKNGK